MSEKRKNSVERSAKLAQWLNRKKEKATPTGIQPMPEGINAPLTFGQQRLWFLQQLYPNNPFYHYSDVYEITGELDSERLKNAFLQVIDRHQILRTGFFVENGQAVQKVNEAGALDFTAFDFSELSQENQQQNAEETARQEARKPFNLAHGSLLRVTLLKFSEKRHQLVLTLHHMVTDEGSMRIFISELSQFYQKDTGAGETLSPLDIQYSDYAYWLRARSSNAQHLIYWKEKLKGDIPMLDLPTDYLRSGQPTFKGAYSSHLLSENISTQVNALSAEVNTTVFVCLFAAFKVFLHRMTSQNDIWVGTPFSNRNQVALESLMGFFNETQVIRSNISGEMTFMDCVKQIKQTVLDAFAHKDTPFEQLVQALNPERRLSSNPLFQTMFLYRGESESSTFGDGLKITQKPFDYGVSKFDLTLYISSENGQLTTLFEYASDLFRAETIQRFQENFAALLAGVVADPHQRISELPILGKQEKTNLLQRWNETYLDLGNHETIHSLIEQQVQRVPDSIAVTVGNEKLSYRELNERANGIAKVLADREIGTNDCVGICADRSADMIVGMLGVLKAGAGYMPIDPAYPKERIQFMIQDSSVSVLLAQPHLAHLFEKENTFVLSFDSIEKTQETPISNSNSVEQLAYVIYTSGSSGQPKGVPVKHKQLLNSTLARTNYYPTSPGAFLLMSSFSFDSSVAGIFWTLCTGGNLVIAEKRLEQGMHKLESVIADNKVTHTLMLPTLYELLLRNADINRLSSLENIMVAGEACPPSLCEIHYDRLPTAKLYNEYGPTEATVWCTVHEIQRNDAKGRVPIGIPIANTQIFILDMDNQLVPIGVAGELHIGGTGVVEGYMNRPSLSETRFIPNPFNSTPTNKLYKTGDLARYRSDGTIEFLGRVDSQVKIRGYRIELDEIKTILTRHEAVREAVVRVEVKNSHDGLLEQNKSDKLSEALAHLSLEEGGKILQSVEQMSDQEIDALLANF